MRGEARLPFAIPDDVSKGFTYGINVGASSRKMRARKRCSPVRKRSKFRIRAREAGSVGRCKIVESFKKRCVAVALDAKGVGRLGGPRKKEVRGSVRSDAAR